MDVLELSVDRTPDFELDVAIDVAPEVLRAFLVDLHRYVPLHPFIESIQDLPVDASIPEARRYRVVDRIPMGPFKLKTVYVAALEPVSALEVHGHAWQSPGIRLRTVYSIEAPTRRGEPTRLVERCHVDAGRLMRGYVVRQARSAHRETLDGMKHLLEAETHVAPPAQGASANGFSAMGGGR